MKEDSASVYQRKKTPERPCAVTQHAPHNQANKKQNKTDLGDLRVGLVGNDALRGQLVAAGLVGVAHADAEGGEHL